MVNFFSHLVDLIFYSTLIYEDIFYLSLSTFGKINAMILLKIFSILYVFDLEFIFLLLCSYFVDLVFSYFPKFLHILFMWGFFCKFIILSWWMIQFIYHIFKPWSSVFYEIHIDEAFY